MNVLLHVSGLQGGLLVPGVVTTNGLVEPFTTGIKSRLCTESSDQDVPESFD